MSRYNNIKQKVLQLVGDFKSDSKSKSAKAEKELIKICEPIIQRFYNIALKFDIPNANEDFDFPYDYSASRGSIDSFVNFENMKLEFYYTDCCMVNIMKHILRCHLTGLMKVQKKNFSIFAKVIPCVKRI